MKALVRSVLLLLLVFCFAGLAAQKAPRLKRVIREAEEGQVVTFDSNGKPIFGEQAIQPYVVGKTYQLNSLVSRNGQIFKAVSDNALEPSKGDDWILIDQFEDEIPVCKIASTGIAQSKSRPIIVHVIGTSKVETSSSGFAQLVERVNQATTKRVYSGNVHLDDFINKSSFITLSTTGTWTRERSYDNTLSGFELTGSDGATHSFKFAEGLSYATPQKVYFYVDGGGGEITIVAKDNANTTFQTEVLNTSGLSGIQEIEISIPASSYENFEEVIFDVSIDNSPVRITGLYATGSEFWTVSNHGVFGWGATQADSIYLSTNYATYYGKTLPDFAIWAHGTNDWNNAQAFDVATREWIDRMREITNDSVTIALSSGSSLSPLNSGGTIFNRDSAAQIIDSMTYAISLDKRTSFASEYQLFGDYESIASNNILTDGVHYTEAAGDALGALWFEFIKDIPSPFFQPWIYKQRAFAENEEQFVDLSAFSDRFLLGLSKDFDTYGLSDVNYVFDSETKFSISSSTGVGTPWFQDYFTLADDRYITYKNNGYLGSDNVLADYNFSTKNISFWPRTDLSQPLFDFTIGSIETPDATKFGTFSVLDAGNKPSISALYNGNTIIYPSQMWSSSGNISAADNKIGKIVSAQEGYAEISGTGYIVLELPEITRSYEFICGELTILRRGTVVGNHLQRESMKETIKFQAFPVAGSSAAYNPNVIFDADGGGMGGYTRNARIIKSSGDAKMYVVIGDAADTYASDRYWAVVENVYFGEDSKNEVYTGEFDIYVSNSLPSGTTRFNEYNTDADSLRQVLLQNNNAGGIEITNAADATTATALTTLQQVQALVGESATTTLTTDANGDITIPHGLGVIPSYYQITVDGSLGRVGTPHNATTTNFQVRVYNALGSVLTNTAVIVYSNVKQ